MDSDVITAQPISGAQVTSTDSDKPPSYYDAILSQPHRGNDDNVENVTDLGENWDNGHEDSNHEQENNEEEDKKKHNRRQADDCCLCCYVGEDDDCVFLRLFLNCCIGIKDGTQSCCDGGLNCLHKCCEPNVHSDNNDNSCCVDCCGVSDSGDNGVDCCGAGDSAITADNSADCDCDCNCFD